MIEIETEVIDEKHFHPLDMKKQPILTHLNEFDFWSTEIFRINFVLINMDFLDVDSNSMRIYLSCEHSFSNEIEIDVKDYSDKFRHRKFVNFHSNVRPLVSVSCKLPDNRLKHQIESCIRKLVAEMVTMEFAHNFLILKTENSIK